MKKHYSMATYKKSLKHSREVSKSNPVGRPAGKKTKTRAWSKITRKAKAKGKSISPTHKPANYQKGTVLTIAYDGINGMFSMNLLSSKSGKKIGEFNITGNTLISSMGNPLMLTQE